MAVYRIDRAGSWRGWWYCLALTLVTAMVLGADAEAKAFCPKATPYTSNISGASVFRDINRDGALNPDTKEDATKTTTNTTGCFALPKGRGRVYLVGGTDIATGHPNNRLLTTPPRVRAISTLTALWQALIDRGQHPGRIKKLLGVDSRNNLANFTAVPIDRVPGNAKVKSKKATLIKRDAQHDTLVQFLKGLVRKSAGIRANPRLLGKQQTLPPCDPEIRALADSLLGIGTVSPVDYTSTDQVQTLMGDSLTRLNVVVQPDDLHAVAQAAAVSINAQVEQADPAQPEVLQAIAEKVVQGETLLSTATVNDFKAAFTPPATPVILGLTPETDTGTNHSDGITQNPQPTLMGTTDSGLAGVNLYLDDLASKIGTATPANGQWTFAFPAPLSEGSHSVYARGVDGSGNESTTYDQKLIVIVTTAPLKPAVQTPTPSSNATPTLSGGWSGNLANRLQVAIGGQSFVPATSGQTWDLAVASPLPPGSYPVTVTETDVAGNSTVAAATDSLVILAPQVTVTTVPATSQGYTRQTQLTWKGTVTAGVSTLQVYLDGSSLGASGQVAPDAEGNWTYTSPVLADGPHSFQISGINTYGFEGGLSAASTVIVKTRPPTVPSVVSLAVVAGDTTPFLSGTWHGDPDSLTVSVDGVRYDAGNGLQVSAVGWSLPLASVGELAVGTHTVTATETDPAGNSADASGSLIVAAAAATPVITGLTAATDSGASSSDGITRNDRPTLTGTAAAADVRVEVYVDYPDNRAGSATVGNGQWSYAFAEALPEGSHRVFVRGVNSIGTESSGYDSRTLTILTTPPLPPLVNSPPATTDTQPTVTGSWSGNPANSLVVTVNQQNYTPALNATTWSLPLPLALTPGSYTVIATETDPAGNGTADQSAVTLVVAPVPSTPVLAGLTAATDTGVSNSDGITRNNAPTLTGNAGTTDVSVNVYLDYPGNRVGSAAVANGQWSFAFADALADGSHPVFVRSVNSIGTESSGYDSRTLTILTTAPLPPIVNGQPATSNTRPTVSGTWSGNSANSLVVTVNLQNYTPAVNATTWSLTLPLDLTPGSYAVAAAESDPAGNRTPDQSAVNLVIAPLPSLPVIAGLTTATDSGASQTDGITRTAAPELTGTAAAGTVSVDLFRDGAKVTHTPLAVTSGTWSYTSPTLPDNTYHFTAIGYNAANTASSASAGYTVVIDTAAPSVTPLVDFLTTTSTTPTLTGSWGAAAGDVLKVTVNGVTYDPATSQTAEGNLWSLTIPAGNALTLDRFAVVASETDTAGNTASSSASDLPLVITPEPPVITGLTPATDSGASQTDGVTNINTPVLVGTAGPGTVSVDIYDSWTDTLLANVPVTAGAWSYGSTALTDGYYDFYAVALSQANTASDYSSNYLVWIVTSQPAPVPTVNPLSTASTTPTVSGTWRNGSGDSVTVTANGVPYSAASSPCTSPPGPGLCTSGSDWNLTIPAANALAVGPYTVTARETDVAGNSADSNSAGVNLLVRLPYTGIITTVAGNLGQSEDGATATLATVQYPGAVAQDTNGNLYIADTFSHRIRKVDQRGFITTVAGTGSAGYGGDNGAATAAALDFPIGIAVDGAGNLYIADQYNHRIRKVDSSGTIKTVAGNGSPGYSGDDVAATSTALNYPFGIAVDVSGNLYIADWYNQRIRRVDAVTGNIGTVAGNGIAGYSGDNGSATSAALNYPKSVAIDGAGNLYIADTNNAVIRKVDTTGIISSIVSSTATDVVLDTSGNLVLADAYNNRILKVDNTGAITTVAGISGAGYSGDNGPATAAALYYPQGIAVDGFGNLYIADTNNHRIRKVDTAGTITTVVGNGTTVYTGDGGPAVVAHLTNPNGVVTDGSGNLYFADTDNHRIRKVESAGTVITVAGIGVAGYSGDTGAATAAALDSPFGIALDGSGHLYIADENNHRIRMLDTATGIISTVAGNGSADFTGDGGPPTAAALYYPTGVAVDGSDNLYIADQYNQRIRKVDIVAGTISTVAGNGTAGYGGDGGPPTAAALYFPIGIAVDGAGNLFIADTYNHRIRKVDTTGTITTFAGTGGLTYSGDNGLATTAALATPFGVSVDRSGNVYIADTSNYRIRMVDPFGFISTIAGDGTFGSGGDGGLAIAAQFNIPHSVAIDGSGNLYVADSQNNRIRRIDLSGQSPAFTPIYSDNFNGSAVGDLNGQSVQTSSTGTVNWSSIGLGGTGSNTVVNDGSNGYVVPNSDAVSSSLASLPYALGSGVYRLSANLYPEYAAPSPSYLGLGFFVQNSGSLLTDPGESTLYLYVEGNGTWSLQGSSEGATAPAQPILSANILTSGAGVTTWSPATPPLITLTWDTVNNTVTATAGAYTLFANFSLANTFIDPTQPAHVGIARDGSLGPNSMIDNFEFAEY